MNAPVNHHDAPAKALQNAYAMSAEQTLQALLADPAGLSTEQAAARLDRFGENQLPRKRPPGPLRVFFNQFRSPLIYVLLAAALVSLLISEYSDAIFIAAVLFLNAVIGTLQEYSAQRSAEALQKLMLTRVRVFRGGEAVELDSQQLVPGDIVLLESGDRVPADLRLLTAADLEIDESLLTGESLAVAKNSGALLLEDTVLGDRVNMAFAGSMVNRGRATGVVVATALATAIGEIARFVSDESGAKAPLQERMHRFTRRIAIFVGFAILVMATILIIRGMPLIDIFLSSVALAVSVIPEGLPVALTVALAIGMRRMARRDVIVRRLIAVEALGSCTFIASDKTGTLTENQLTARCLKMPGRDAWSINGDSHQPNGEILGSDGEVLRDAELSLLQAACECAVLANEGYLGERDGEWQGNGDAVDVALLMMARRAGFSRDGLLADRPQIDSLPFESEHLCSASLHQGPESPEVFVKGALEKLLPMCNRLMQGDGEIAFDATALEDEAARLASAGYRVIALARGELALPEQGSLRHDDLRGLCLVGLVGLIDPLRSEAKDAVRRCQAAGIEVAMVTGDHPLTAGAIGRELGLVGDSSGIVTGPELKAAQDEAEFDRLTRGSAVFARVEPRQKLDIVQSLQRNGHFVAVSGDGANDAPALRAAQVGVAMGKSGTDVARESADIIITDDNFASIVDGVEQGRIAYANVRKVIFLLVSTGAAELVLFTLSMLTGLPLPLLAVQLLWLNLVTNGIQDIALAFEPGEGHELERPPRPPREAIFNRLMIERVVISALVIGVVAFGLFRYLLEQGFTLEQARNHTLLLMVLFENVHVFNCRSETLSVFRHNPLRNRLLLLGTVVAQLVHIGAMYTPWLGDVLGASPVSFSQWLHLLGLALSVMLVMELHKWVRRYLSLDNRIHPGMAG